MKTEIVWMMIGVGVLVSIKAVANECIIDPEKVMVHAASEPIFLSAEERTREVASQSGDDGKHFSRGHDQYLDIQKVIPFSEPAVHRAWLEYKILRED